MISIVTTNNSRNAWVKLEDKAKDIVVKSSSAIDAVWVYSGAIFRDKNNPANEAPDEEFDNVVRLTTGDFGVLDATYEVIGSFDENKNSQARDYVFEKPHEGRVVYGEQKPDFNLPDSKFPIEHYLVQIDDLEDRCLDFFPVLRNSIELLIEGVETSDLWGDGIASIQ